MTEIRHPFGEAFGVMNRLTALALRSLASLAAAAMVNAAARSEPLSGQDDLGVASAVVQELSVVGRRPGPALWRVRRQGGEVTILGAVSPIPHLLQWDTIRVQRAVDQSTLLLLEPTRVRVGLFDVPTLVLRQGDLKAGRGGLDAQIDAPSRERFERLTASMGLDPKKYQEWRPAIAGLLLLGDFHRAAGLSQEKPGTTVAKMARASHADVRVAGSLRFKDVFQAAARLSRTQHQQCFNAAMDEVEWQAAHARPAALAWSVGDLKGVRSNTRTSFLDLCLEQSATAQSMIEEGTTAGVKMIEEALSRPSPTVAVVDLAFLLRANGVLDRLRRAGAEVTVPAD